MSHMAGQHAFTSHMAGRHAFTCETSRPPLLQNDRFGERAEHPFHKPERHLQPLSQTPLEQQKFYTASSAQNPPKLCESSGKKGHVSHKSLMGSDKGVSIFGVRVLGAALCSPSEALALALTVVLPHSAAFAA